MKKKMIYFVWPIAVALSLCACANTDESAYADIYKTQIEELSSQGQADLFALVNVDDDEIPELAAISSEGSWDKDQVFLYTTDGKEAVLLASDIGPGMEGHFIGFFEKENVFVKSGAPTGEAFEFYKIDNFKPVKIMAASRVQMTDEDGNETDSCMVDEKEVAPDEYIAALKEIIPSARMTQLADEGSAEMISYDVSFDDGYMELTGEEKISYYSLDDIAELLASNN